MKSILQDIITILNTEVIDTLGLVLCTLKDQVGHSTFHPLGAVQPRRPKAPVAPDAGRGLWCVGWVRPSIMQYLQVHTIPPFKGTSSTSHRILSSEWGDLAIKDFVLKDKYPL